MILAKGVIWFRNLLCLWLLLLLGIEGKREAHGTHLGSIMSSSPHVANTGMFEAGKGRAREAIAQTSSDRLRPEKKVLDAEIDAVGAIDEQPVMVGRVENQTSLNASYSRNKSLIRSALPAMMSSTRPFRELHDLSMTKQSTVVVLLTRIFQDMELFGHVAGAYLLFLFLIVWSLLSMPTTPIELCAGFIYGAGLGSIACMMGKTCGAVAALLIGREVGAKRGWTVPRVLETHLDALNEQPFCTMVIIRLLPIPVGLKNYGLAMCGPAVDLLNFSASAFIVNCPFSIMWTSLGAQFSSIADALDFDATLGFTAYTLKVAFAGLVVVVVVITFILQQQEFLFVSRKGGAK